MGSFTASFEDATEERIFEDPKIIEEKELDLEKYMVSKEQKFTIAQKQSFTQMGYSSAVSQEEVILQKPNVQIHWQSRLPQFF
jgi:hypothetical protein